MPLPRPFSMAAAGIALAVLAACTIPSPKATAAAARGDAPPSAVQASVRKAIGEVSPGAKVDSIHPSPITGLYEVRSEGAVVYVSSDGKHLISGDLYDVRSRKNLTDLARAEVHLGKLRQSPAKDHIRFGPKDAKETIYVFTDITCHYCQEFHKQVPAINRLGIAVEYLAYPRSGPDGDVAAAMAAIWCSKDRTGAYGKAIKGQVPSGAAAPACKDLVAKQFALGESLEVQGTPAIFSRGHMIGGYLSAAQVRQAVLLKAGSTSGSAVAAAD